VLPTSPGAWPQRSPEDFDSTNGPAMKLRGNKDPGEPGNHDESSADTAAQPPSRDRAAPAPPGDRTQRVFSAAALTASVTAFMPERSLPPDPAEGSAT